MSDRVFRLEFTFGPVQGFIGSARRTRDVWLGSWLLSKLARAALEAVLALDPKPELQIPGSFPDGEAGTGDNVAAVPNRFAVLVSSTRHGQEAGEAATRALKAAWAGCADRVWEQLLHGRPGVGDHTRAIWDRQIAASWQVQWAVESVGPAGRGGGLLAQVKHGRRHAAEEEPGFHCTLMPRFQELSGCVGLAGIPERDHFWANLRGSLGSQIDTLDLAPGERLSAPAFVKRMLPRVEPGEAQENRAWPSVAFVAARPFFHALAGCDSAKCREASAAMVSAAAVAGGRGWLHRSETHAAGDLPSEVRSMACWDASVLHAGGVHRLLAESRKDQSPEPADAEVAADLARAVRGLRKAAKDAGVDPPPPFFAVVVMDGDSLGQTLAGMDRPSELSQKLLNFTAGVKAIAPDHHASLVYAGGDDVLALIPVASVLAFVSSVSEAYKRELGTPGASISAGVHLVHLRTPLQVALREAHRLLDDEAKEACGRDAVAFGLTLGSGPAAQWSLPMACLADLYAGDDSPERPAAASLAEVVRQLREAGRPSSFLHRFAALVGQLTEVSRERGGFAPLPGGLDLGLLARSEWDRGRAARGGVAGRRELLEPLLQLTRRHRRVRETPRTDAGVFGVDGLRIAAFLADPAGSEAHR